MAYNPFINTVEQQIRKVVTNDQQSVHSASKDALKVKIQTIKEKLVNREAEIERLDLQIKELSRKIDSEPVSNLLDNVVKNPVGTIFNLKINKIKVVGSKENSQNYETLMYAIQGSKDEYFSSLEVNKSDDKEGCYVFDSPQSKMLKGSDLKTMKN